MPDPGPEALLDSGHLDSNDIAAYVDGALDDAARARVDAHLAACGQCRAELIAVRRILAGAPRRRRWFALTTIAAAAAVVLLIVWPRDRDRGVPGGPVVRDGETPGAVVMLIAPDSVAGLPLSFAWRPLPNATTYRVSLTTTSGVLIWSGATADTTMAVPDSVSVASGTAFYYYVDALLTDGTSVSSGVRQVRVRP
jgi:hypothetical protein